MDVCDFKVVCAMFLMVHHVIMFKSASWVCKL